MRPLALLFPTVEQSSYHKHSLAVVATHPTCLRSPRPAHAHRRSQPQSRATQRLSPQVTPPRWFLSFALQDPANPPPAVRLSEHPSYTHQAEETAWLDPSKAEHHSPGERQVSRLALYRSFLPLHRLVRFGFSSERLPMALTPAYILPIVTSSLCRSTEGRRRAAGT